MKMSIQSPFLYTMILIGLLLSGFMNSALAASQKIGDNKSPETLTPQCKAILKSLNVSPNELKNPAKTNQLLKLKHKNPSLWATLTAACKPAHLLGACADCTTSCGCTQTTCNNAIYAPPSTYEYNQCTDCDFFSCCYWDCCHCCPGCAPS